MYTIVGCGTDVLIAEYQMAHAAQHMQINLYQIISSISTPNQTFPCSKKKEYVDLTPPCPALVASTPLQQYTTIQLLLRLSWMLPTSFPSFLISNP